MGNLAVFLAESSAFAKFDIDIIEYNKFLSINFNIEESELAF